MTIRYVALSLALLALPAHAQQSRVPPRAENVIHLLCSRARVELPGTPVEPWMRGACDREADIWRLTYDPSSVEWLNSLLKTKTTSK